MTFLEMDNQSETNEYDEFLLKMSLVYFIVSIVGFLMFAVLLIYYITYINLKKVETVSKFIIGILFAFNVSQLTLNAVSYLKTVDNQSLPFLIIDLIILYMIVGIQFIFLYDMGEVYFKITSDDPKVYQNNLKKIKAI